MASESDNCWEFDFLTVGSMRVRRKGTEKVVATRLRSMESLLNPFAFSSLALL